MPPGNMAGVLGGLVGSYTYVRNRVVSWVGRRTLTLSKTVLSCFDDKDTPKQRIV